MPLSERFPFNFSSGYGRHLAETIEHRAIWRGFATIAQFCGTAALPVMLADIQRGIKATLTGSPLIAGSYKKLETPLPLGDEYVQALTAVVRTPRSGLGPL